MPSDFLARALEPAGPPGGRRRHEGPPPDDGPGPDGDPALALPEHNRLELRRLRDENDRLRLLREFQLLESILEPLLVAERLPPELDQALGRLGLRESHLGAMAAMLQSPAVALFGHPGETLRLELPCAEYALDPRAPVLEEDLSRSRYRVSRRGVRVHGLAMIPALVVPVHPEPRGAGRGRRR